MIRFVRQEGLRDCGVCSLYNIIKYYGGNIDIEKLRKMTNTNENGTSIYNLVNTSNKLGFNTKAYRCSINDLQSQILPLIAYIKIKDYYHFVIIKDIDVDKIELFDPIRGKLIYSFEEFEKEWQNIIITFERKGNIVKETSIYTKYLLDLFHKYKKTIILLVSLSLFCTILEILISLYMKQIFDNNLYNKTLFLFVILILIKGGLDYARTKISINFNNTLEYEFSDKVTSKIFSLPYSYHHNRPVGDIIYRINDLGNIKEFINTITLISFIDILFLAISLLIILFISIKVFFISIIFIIGLLLIYFYFRKNEYNYYQKAKESYSDYSSYLIDRLYGINTIKNFGIEKKIIDKKNDLLKTHINISNKLQNYINIENTIFKYVESYGILIVMFIGYGLIKDKRITIGDLSLLYSLLLSIYNSLKNFSLLDKIILQSKLSFNRINSFINIKKELSKETKVIKKISSIEFKNYSFKKNTSPLNLIINKGDSVLLYGDSGIGKSTIFYHLNKDLEGGNGILINNIELDYIKSLSIKNNISFISQNEYIFNDSIKNNILLNKNIKQKEIDKVLKVSTLDKVLKRKNINLDYLLEENGHNLSGGERKKVLIARALVRNTDYIILDETFDEIDINNERKIINNIITEYKKTIIVISHRCSNLDLYNKKIEIK